MTKFLDYLKALPHMLSTKIGAILAAVTGAATAANALQHPWNWITFGAAIALVIWPA